MRYLAAVLFFIFGFVTITVAQQNNTFYRWYFQQEVGTNFALTQVKMDVITDNLLSLNEPNPYWKVANVGYNFSPSLSVQLSYQMDIRGENKRSEKFGNAIDAQYQSSYYRLKHETNEDKKSPYFVTNVERGMIGFHYTKQMGKLKFNSGLSVGTTYFYSDSASVFLKEKGTNHTQQLRFTSTEKSAVFRTLSPSILCLYPFGNRHELFFTAAYFINFYDISYEIETKNVFTKSRTTESILYKGEQHTLGFGIGVRFNIREVRN